VRQVGYYQEFVTRCTVNKIQNFASNRLAPRPAARPARPLVRPWIRSWVGHRTGLHNPDTRKSSSFTRELKHSSLTLQLLSYSLFWLQVRT